MSTPDVRLEVVIGFVGIFGIVNHYYEYVCRFPEFRPVSPVDGYSTCPLDWGVVSTYSTESLTVDHSGQQIFKKN